MLGRHDQFSTASIERFAAQLFESTSGDGDSVVQNLLDGYPGSTMIVDREGHITHLNTQARDYYDCTDVEAKGKRPQALHPAATDETEIVQKALEAQTDISERTKSRFVDDFPDCADEINL